VVVDGLAVFVSEKSAGIATPDTVAATENCPAVALAVRSADDACPLAPVLIV
jgi:hypothetical protein